MTKETGWLRDRTHTLLEQLHVFGVALPEDDARMLILTLSRGVATDRGISRTRAQAVITDDYVRAAASKAEELCTAPGRAALAASEGKSLTLRAAQVALIGLLETILLDRYEDNFGSTDSIHLALRIANTIAPRLSTTETVELSGRSARSLHSALREGAARVLEADEVPYADDTLDLHHFLLRTSNGVVAVPDRAVQGP